MFYLCDEEKKSGVSFKNSKFQETENSEPQNPSRIMIFLKTSSNDTGTRGLLTQGS